MFDLKGQAKYDAWVKQKGKSAEVAMQEYIDLVQQMSEA
jgi:acyl-CoA-binding protein